MKKSRLILMAAVLSIQAKFACANGPSSIKPEEPASSSSSHSLEHLQLNSVAPPLHGPRPDTQLGLF